MIDSAKSEPIALQSANANYIACKQREGESIEQFRDRFALAIEELALLGDNRSTHLNDFVNALDPKYASVTLPIGLNPGYPSFGTLERLSEVIKNSWEFTIQHFAGKADGPKRDLVAAVQESRFLGKCFNCGIIGHKAFQCRKPKRLKQATDDKTSKDSTTAYLDSLASISLTNDLSMLDNIRMDEGEFKNANGSAQFYNTVGSHRLLGERTIYLKGAPITIASMARVKENYEMEYDQEEDTFTFRARDTGAIEYFASCVDGVYPIQHVDEPVDDEYIEKDQEIVMAMSKADRYRQIQILHRRILHANADIVRKGIRLGHYSDIIPPTSKAITQQDCAKMILECATCFMMKDSRLPNLERGVKYERRRHEIDESDPIKRQYNLKDSIEAECCFDLVYVGSDIAVCMVVKPHNYLLMDWVRSRNTECVRESIIRLVHRVQASAGIGRVISLSADREKAVSAVEEELIASLHVLLKQSVPHMHERRIERQVRTLRNRHRCCIEELAVPLTKQLRRLSWEHVVKASNFILNTNSGDYLPIQIQNKEEAYRTPPRFGEFVVVSSGPTNDKEAPRNDIAMIVGFEERTRAVYVKFRGQGNIHTRGGFTVLEDQEAAKKLFREYADPPEVAEEQQNEREDPFQVLNPDPSQSSTLANDASESKGEEATMVLVETSTEATNGAAGNVEATNGAADNVTEDQGQAAVDHGALPPRRSTRPKQPKELPPDFIWALTELDRECGLELSRPPEFDEFICGLVEQAAVQGEEGKRAATAIELQRVWLKYKSIEPVDLDEVQKSGRVEVVPGMMFSTEKHDVAGVFARNKSRMVVRGDRRKEKPTELLKTFSPTVAHPTVLLVLNIILERGYAWQVMDVESAYLNSDFDEPMYMRLEAGVAELMVEMDPEVKRFVEPRGTIVVKINKALYGLQESAKLWYDTLHKALERIGLHRSNYDHALFYQEVEGELIIVIVYVDDMLLAGPESECQRVGSELKELFTINATQMSPTQFDYVGIRVEYDGTDQAFNIRQPGMVNKIVDGCNEVAEVPCDVNLFVETDETPIEEKTAYRSKLMEMNYLSKTRPDIKVALGYLATKMEAPTAGDEKKLQRLKMYINGTKDYRMRIKPIGAIQAYASADASFGPFADGKSNTGMVLTVGTPNAPVLAKSAKQKSVANSSTAAELIAFSSTIEEVLWMTELLNELGFAQDTVDIEQDNNSTMRLVEKGPSSAGRTKWLNIKHFWVSEHLASGQVRLKYVPSLEMLADGLTKPLGKKAFFVWRGRILNHRIRGGNN